MDAARSDSHAGPRWIWSWCDASQRERISKFCCVRSLQSCSETAPGKARGVHTSVGQGMHYASTCQRTSRGMEKACSRRHAGVECVRWYSNANTEGQALGFWGGAVHTGPEG